jgi:hypothetical protein
MRRINKQMRRIDRKWGRINWKGVGYTGKVGEDRQE